VRRLPRTLLIILLILVPAVVVALDYFEDLAEARGIFPSDFSVMSAGRLVFLISIIPQRALGLASKTGYAGIFLLMLLEAAALPIPSEIVLPFAGYLVSQGTLSFWPVVFFSTIAALIGSLIDYYLGLRLGSGLLAGNSRLPFVNPDHLGKVKSWFERYGGVAVALFRLMPAARVLISFPAGAYRMSRLKFAVYTLAGCLPWNIGLVLLGWQLGSLWSAVVGAFTYVNIVAYSLIIIFLLWIAGKFTHRRSLTIEKP
jgi:membrane protein DedA with SNARE-associated domain